ncbi:uncharacterized protein T551_02136 [Pneumocystis jirovecii RU7]|uniref:ERCC1-like central domain-containing protein n=1 Tax=Pneumocystis jirovecii (strain RU7) TaxID=1408657 RepID=A0A0W4ZME3_PNEJ7|nr:uncharacterized protein T551_02136 [Pneumocystis jirovecii RU7]KTW29520.1 hypothetical protein T551_02136 [Pneumocystis jirovecii RU7]
MNQSMESSELEKQDKLIKPVTSDNSALRITPSTRATGLHAILVNPRQKKNPVLEHIRNVPWEYGDSPADYVLGAGTCALFLSLRYHLLYPGYIYHRLQNLGKGYRLRILLILVDYVKHDPIEDCHETALRELTKTCIINDATLILSWSFAEAGRYLETYKSLEHASFSIIQGKSHEDYYSKLVECFTSIRYITKDDTYAMLSNFRSIKKAVNAEKEEILMIGGWGEQKANLFKKTVTQPFIVKDSEKQ